MLLSAVSRRSLMSKFVDLLVDLALEKNNNKTKILVLLNLFFFSCRDHLFLSIFVSFFIISYPIGERRTYSMIVLHEHIWTWKWLIFMVQLVFKNSSVTKLSDLLVCRMFDYIPCSIFKCYYKISVLLYYFFLKVLVNFSVL